MVCINDVNVGTVIEPYAGGYISTRSSAGSEISETTAMIPTQSDIYQSLSLMMGETNGETVGDLKAYVYEQSDYDAKVKAIIYTLSQNKSSVTDFYIPYGDKSGDDYIIDDNSWNSAKKALGTG